MTAVLTLVSVLVAKTAPKTNGYMLLGASVVPIAMGFLHRHIKRKDLSEQADRIRYWGWGWGIGVVMPIGLIITGILIVLNGH